MSRNIRTPSEEERALLEIAMRDVKPLKGATPRSPKARPAKAVAPTKAVPPARPPATPSASTPARPPQHGLDGRTAERLRQGRLDPGARLDLHGLTQVAAHTALLAFLRSSHRRGLRLVLIVTGKGERISETGAPFEMSLVPRTKGVLKSMLPRWLAEPDLARFIAGTCVAHRRHGGAGAIYVYLRKPSR